MNYLANMPKINGFQFLQKTFIALLTCVSLLSVEQAFAHGERAQQAGLRMRTLNWFDFEVSTTKLAVNETVTISGKFVPSVWWPEHMASIEDTAYLNVGISGPVLVRMSSYVNGVPTIRSQSYKKGETYEYEITLKGRTPGKYHLHPVVNVEGAGPIIGPGRWIEVTGSYDDFENSVTTLTGETIELESYGYKEFFWTHLFWIVIGVAWVTYWFRKLPVAMPRFNKVLELGEDANQIITLQDMIVSFGFFLFTLVAITAGYFYGQSQYPITTPLQTSKVNIPILEKQEHVLDIEVKKATYRIPGRSFRVDMEITNLTDRTFRIGEFSTANIRFINKTVLPGVKPADDKDLVASQGLTIEGRDIAPNQTTTITMYADDALWETYRLTSLIYDPDSRFAGMLFFYDENMERFHYEIGGAMIPVFK